MLKLKRTLNITSVAVTHDMTSAFTISDRIVMIRDGGVVFSGTPDEIRETRDPYVRDFIEGNAPHDVDTQTLLRSAG